jgi:prepilin-type N-terminal cleavage/methylation domain-containing protein
MKKAFTLIELIVVIVVLGILSTITFDVLSKLYENYVNSKELNALSSKTDTTMNVIAAKMRSRIKNSLIATKIDTTTFQPIDFKSIQDLKDTDTEYIALEWISKDYQSKRGIFLDNLGRVQTGWSGFVDLDSVRRTNTSPKEFNMTLSDSNFTIVKYIDGNLTEFNGDIFDKNVTVLIFSGADGRGDFNEMNKSYGWYKGGSNQAQKVFRISQYNTNSDNNTEVNITSIDPNDDVTIYEQYFLAHSAYSIVPKQNSGREDYNLSLYYNYQPWRDQNYTDGNETILATNVTEFRFKEFGGVLRIYLCIQSPIAQISITNVAETNLTICKEKVIF